ncbi:MAG: hypothetical protein AAB429_02995 [Patescibacteria group bacterium]
MVDAFFFDVFLAIVWLFFFLRRRETRQEMVIIGIVALLFSPLFLFLGRQETAGTVAISDLAFSFFLAGIAAVIFEAVFGQHYRIGHHARLSLKNSTERWFLRLMLMAIVWAWLSIILLLVMGTDALQSLGAAGLVIGSYMIASRHDLLWNALWSGLLMAIVFFFVYLLAFIASLPTTTQFFLTSIPADAVTWAITLGLVFGPMYEFVRGFRLRH